MPITPEDRSVLAGIPQQWTESISAVIDGLIQGSTPPVVTEDMTVAASQTIPALTPVGLNGSGHLIPAVLTTTPAIGILLIAVTTAGGAVKGAPVLRGGRVNKDAINWPATYDNDTKKFGAFRGAPTPTNFVVVKVWDGATVAQP